MIDNLIEIYKHGVKNKQKYNPNHGVSDKLWTGYRHVCPDGKQYFGITSQEPEERWGSNGGGYISQRFQEAIDEFGWDNIKHEVLIQDRCRHLVEDFEKLCILEFETTDRENGYNISVGGNITFLDRKHTPETLDKMSKKNRGEGNGGSKLIEEDVLYIRKYYKHRDKEFGITPLAKKFNVSTSAIYNIINRVYWKHI